MNIRVNQIDDSWKHEVEVNSVVVGVGYKQDCVDLAEELRADHKKANMVRNMMVELLVEREKESRKLEETGNREILRP